MLFITTYISPDTDGVACCIGFSELLAKLGRESTPIYFGDLSPETEFIKKYTKFFPLKKSKGKYPENSEYVLVDTSSTDSIEPVINSGDVIEVFDHRELFYAVDFKNAKLHIEKTGSCATLITELFRKNKIVPSKNTAIYLYSAIVSNTVNFKNFVTTTRDIDAATWLKTIARIEEGYIKKMFEFKSKIESWEDLLFLIEQDFAVHPLHGKNYMIAQVEIVNLETAVNKYEKQIIDELKKLKEQETLEYFMFSGIDIVKGFNIFIVADQGSGEFFARVLGVPVINQKYKNKKIIMRKEIWPKVERLIASS